MHIIRALILVLWVAPAMAQGLRHTVQLGTMPSFSNPLWLTTAQYEYRLPDGKWGLGMHGTRVINFPDGDFRELGIGPNVRYHFMEYSKGRLDPYLGLGYSYTRRTFQGPELPISHHGIKWQAGVGYFFTEHFALSYEMGNYRYTNRGVFVAFGVVTRF